MIDDDRPPPRRRVGRRIGWGIVGVIVIAALVGAVVVAVKLPRASTDLPDAASGTLRVDANARGEWQVGGFSVLLGSRLRVTHPDAEKPVWESPAREAFLTAGVGDPWFVDDHGILRISDRLEQSWGDQRIQTASVDAEGALTLAGTLTDDEGDDVRWELRLAQGVERRLDVSASVSGEADRLFLASSLDPEEGVHGFGAQSAAWNLRGQHLALVPREQGIGRGAQPLSFLVDFQASAAGGQDTASLVSGVNVTDDARSFAYRGDAIAAVDLRPEDRMIWEVWAPDAEFSFAAASEPLDALQVQSTWTGAAAPPPAWASRGLIAGLQGGTDEVREKVAALQEAGTPLAAVWLPDWAGIRSTPFGDRPSGNGTLDAGRYPDADALVAELAEQGIRVLTSVSPLLSKDGGEASALRGGRDLYAEAEKSGFLALDEDGEVLEGDQPGFPAASVDLSNEDAREWLAQAIADEAAAVTSSGWMADLGEGPPPDARLQGGLGIDWRVRWPVLWQQVNMRALELSGLGTEGLVWHRSGTAASAGSADALWMADQVQDWSAEDGLRSMIALTQSLSASGMAQVHGDIGGATSIDLPVFADVVRDDELLVRWAEASLLQPLFRTHEGSRPDAAAQPADDPQSARQVARLARLFVALSGERARLAAAGPVASAAQHPWMLSPSDPLLAKGSADDQLQLGPDLLLAPVLQPGTDSIAVTFPPGRWTHVWTGAVYGNSAGVTQSLVSAPQGRPALFARSDTAVAAELAAFVDAEEEAG